jgi:hypothetical protein
MPWFYFRWQHELRKEVYISIFFCPFPELAAAETQGGEKPPKKVQYNVDVIIKC